MVANSLVSYTGKFKNILSLETANSNILFVEKS